MELIVVYSAALEAAAVRAQQQQGISDGSADTPFQRRGRVVTPATVRGVLRHACGQPVSTIDIARTVGARPSAISTIMARGMAAGCIERVGRGLYRWSGKADA